jgi:NADPH-dependent ferric siderophore reductase
VLAGDHAALPAIQTILAALPSSTVAHVYAEVESEAEHLPLQANGPVIVHWLHTAAGAMPGRVLQSALAGITLPPGKGRVFVACEAGVMREIRRHVLYERGLSREQVYTHGYWKQGEANHPDHDLGEEI